MLLRTVLSDMAAAPGCMLDDARADGRGEQTPHMRGDDAGDSGSAAASELRALESSEPKLEVRSSAGKHLQSTAILDVIVRLLVALCGAQSSAPVANGRALFSQ